MGNEVSRRGFLGTAGSVVAAGAVMQGTRTSAAAESGKSKIRILGICCSPRKGMTTATSLQTCLKAAAGVAPDKVETELIELAGMKINGLVAAGIPLEPGERDDFPPLVPKLSDPRVAGVIIGTPVYFGNMTSLCKAFLERCIVFRKNHFALANKVAGVLAVGGTRNGGQEMTIKSVQTALMAQDMILVGDGAPTAHVGATLWSGIEGGITADEFGMGTAENLGRRVTRVAMLVHGGA